MNMLNWRQMQYSYLLEAIWCCGWRQTGAGFQPQIHMGELLKLFASELLSVNGDDINDSAYPMYLVPLLILSKFLPLL